MERLVVELCWAVCRWAARFGFSLHGKGDVDIFSHRHVAEMVDQTRGKTMKAVLPHALAFLSLCAAHSCWAENFQSDSKRFGNPKMDIVITETERKPGISVLDIKINRVGSSVGSSFFILCSLRDLARQRGNYRHIVKLEEKPGRNQMLVGFLSSAGEPPEKVDPEFAGQRVIDLEQFSPICEKMN